MTKHKKITTSHDKITTIFGYSLFAATVISFLVSTVIPFSISLTYPTARHFNIVVMVVAFAIATILPALASYFIGDKATHAKNKSLHHYNGVLFGIAAYWVALLFSWVGFGAVLGVSESPFPIPLVMANVMPVIATIILMAIVAAAYAKKQNNKSSVLQYRPFQIVLIAAIIAGFIYPYFSGNFEMNVANLSSAAIFLAIPVVAVAIAYKVLAKHHVTRLARLSDAIVALSMGWIATWVANTLTSYLQLPWQISSIPAYVIGLLVFIGYLYLRTRKS